MSPVRKLKNRFMPVLFFTTAAPAHTVFGKHTTNRYYESVEYCMHIAMSLPALECALNSGPICFVLFCFDCARCVHNM